MNLIKWLINGDVSVKYQTKRDLLGETDYIFKKINQKKYKTNILEELKDEDGGINLARSITMLSCPSKWENDILHLLDYLRESEVKYDNKMEDALIFLISKEKKDGTWPSQKKNLVNLDLSSRWNTLRALRVLKYYKFDYLLNKVLFKVNKLFSENNIRFGIGASLLLKSFNLVSKVSDIDIIIHNEDVEKVIEIMNTIGIRIASKELALYETENFLEYNVDGIDLDIMAKFSVKTDEGVFVYPFDVKELKYKVVLNCNKVPVLSLENWFVSYLVIRRKEKAEIVKKYLIENGFNKILLKNALKLEISTLIRNEINYLLEYK